MFWSRGSKKQRTCCTSVTVAKVWPVPEADERGLPAAPSAESRVPEGVERRALCAARVGLQGPTEHLSAGVLGLADGPFEEGTPIVCDHAWD